MFKCRRCGPTRQGQCRFLTRVRLSSEPVPGPAILVIALATNEIGSARTAAILTTAHQVLGDQVSVRLEVVDAALDSRAVLSTHPTSAYAWLSWDKTNTHLAHLGCFIPSSQRWVQRDVAFAPEDPDIESGRTLGFVIASTYVDGIEYQTKTREQVPRKPEVGRTEVSRHKRFELQGAASLAGLGDATSMGAWFGIQMAVAQSFHVGAAGDIRFGTVGKAQSSERFIATGILGTLRAWPQSGRTWLGCQAFIGAEQVRFSHFSEDDLQPVTQTSWVPRLDLLGIAAWEVSNTSQVFLGLGTNFRFGQTDVLVRGIERAHLPAWIAIARVGLGTSF